MRGPRSPQARRAVELFATAPIGDRFHVRARWWSAPFAALERMVPVRGRVLEVGCGHGLLSLYLGLASRAREVQGLDVDEHKIALARRAAAGLAPGEASVSFAVGSAAELGEEGAWDAVVIADVLYLLPEALRWSVLDACAGRLGPGGILLVKELDTTPRWKDRLATAQEVVATRILRYTQGEGVDIAPMAEFARRLEDRGLIVTTTRLDRGYPHAHTVVAGRRADPS